MRKLKILFIIFMSACFLSADMTPPTKEMDAVDIADPKQRKRDMKVFQNMLFVYGQVRQTAEGAVEVLNTVSDFALKSFSTFKQVQKLVGKGRQIYSAMKKLDMDDFKNPKNWKEALEKLDDVSNTWSDFYSHGSSVLGYQTDKSINILSGLENSRNVISAAVNNVDLKIEGIVLPEDKIGKENKIKQILSQETQSISSELYWFKRGVLQGVEVVDPYITEKHSYHPKVKKNIAITSVAEDGIAGAAVRKEYAQNQLALSRYSMSNAAGGLGGEPNEESAITAQASAEALSSQNSLVLSLGEHESINALTKVMSAMALSKADNYFMKDYNQKLYVAKNMRKHSDELSLKLQEIKNAKK